MLCTERWQYAVVVFQMENRLILRAHCDSTQGVIKGAARTYFLLHAGTISKLLYGFAYGMYGQKIHSPNCMYRLTNYTLHFLLFWGPIRSKHINEVFSTGAMGAQWLSGRVLDSRPKGRGFEPHRRHCVVVFKQDTFILAYTTFTNFSTIYLVMCKVYTDVGGIK